MIVLSILGAYPPLGVLVLIIMGIVGVSYLCSSSDNKNSNNNNKHTYDSNTQNQNNYNKNNNTPPYNNNNSNNNNTKPNNNQNNNNRRRYNNNNSNNNNRRRYNNNNSNNNNRRQNNQNIKKIDINTAGIDEIKKLPGIGLISAKKLIQMRENGNYVESLNDLENKLNLKPYQVEQLKPYLTISKIKTKKTSYSRKVDL